MGGCLKGGAPEQLADLRGELGMKVVNSVFLIPQCTLWMNSLLQMLSKNKSLINQKPDKGNSLTFI